MDVAAILTEVAGALVNTGLTVYATAPDTGDFPALVVNPPTSITYTQTLNGSCTLEVPVTLYVSNSSLATAWELVYQLLSYNTAGTPIPDALLSHSPTTYKNLNVTTASNFRPVGETGIAVDINLTIYS